MSDKQIAQAQEKHRQAIADKRAARARAAYQVDEITRLLREKHDKPQEAGVLG